MPIRNTMKPKYSLIYNKHFIEHLNLFIRQYNKLEEELSIDYLGAQIPNLKSELLLNKKILDDVIMSELNTFRDNNLDKKMIEIEFPVNFNEVLSDFFEIRKLKNVCVNAQKYEMAASLRDKEKIILEQESVKIMIEKTNTLMAKELSLCKTPETYNLTAHIILKNLIAFLGEQFDLRSLQIEKLCCKWCLVEISYALKLCKKKEYKYAIFRIGFRKSEWEKFLALGK